MTKAELIFELDKLNVSPRQYNIGFPVKGNAINLVFHNGFYRLYFLGDPSGPSNMGDFASEADAYEAMLARFQKTYDYSKRDINTIFLALSLYTLFDKESWARIFSEQHLNVPEGVRGFYHTYDGFDGRIGNRSKVIFWKSAVAVIKNQEMEKLYPDLFFIGENENHERYAISRIESCVFAVKDSRVFRCADDFLDLLFYLFDLK